MKRSEARTAHLSVLLAAATGFVYGWMLYCAEPEDEFALVNHPWQPTLRYLHVMVVPLFVFVLGMLWPQHIVQKLKSGQRARRRTGIALVALALGMIVSGYALQVAVAPGWHTIWVWGHGITSVLFTGCFGQHLLVRVRPART